MKLCYLDESGKQDSDRRLGLVGIMVDNARLNRSRPRACAKWFTALAPKSLKALGGKN
jgi:hypothetical protein